MTIEQLVSPVSADTESGNYIVNTCRDIASTQASYGIHTLFRPSWTDVKSGRHGIRWLICKILAEMNAYGSTASRKDLIKKSLYTSEIIKKVREYYTEDKYPDHTIEHNLSYVMKDQVGKIQLTSKEDPDRPCRRPRCKWYLLGSPFDQIDHDVNLS